MNEQPLQLLWFFVEFSGKLRVSYFLYPAVLVSGLPLGLEKVQLSKPWFLRSGRSYESLNNGSETVLGLVASSTTDFKPSARVKADVQRGRLAACR